MEPSTILIVEDDATLLRGLKDSFEGKGFRVRIAADGEQGLEEALSGSVDIILLDIMLPKVNGYEICRQLRERGIETPIVMLTAKGQEEDIVLGLNLGADDYVIKPFRMRELYARISALLRRRQTRGRTVVQFGDFSLDLAARKLTKGGEELTLTAKEFGLLEYFAARSGRALTRDDILNHVWGHSVMVTPRSVDRCVTTLRAKIERDPRCPKFIQTIRDIGYRFEPDPASS